ncbi:hypothetical protein [Bartonella tribocorum]|nr:hypothetical protein [Bartonella tribocorum]CDO49548.1 hypothetical protein BM1374166_01904 [Bartonella tribocorum]
MSGAWNEDKASAGGKNKNEAGKRGILYSVDEGQAFVTRKEQCGKVGGVRGGESFA